MKKFLTLILAICMVIPMGFMFAGCSDEYKDKYDQLVVEKQQLQQENSTLEQEIADLEDQIAILEQQVEDLEATLESSILYYDLTVATNLVLDVKVGTEFLVCISENSGYLYMDSSKTVSVKIKSFSAGTFVDYENLASGSYFTPGAGMYRVSVQSIEGAESTQITLDLADAQRA